MLPDEPVSREQISPRPPICLHIQSLSLQYKISEADRLIENNKVGPILNSISTLFQDSNKVTLEFMMETSGNSLELLFYLQWSPQKCNCDNITYHEVSTGTCVSNNAFVPVWKVQGYTHRDGGISLWLHP